VRFSLYCVLGPLSLLVLSNMLTLERYLAELKTSSDKLGTLNNIKNVCFHGLTLDDLSVAAFSLFSKSSKVCSFFFCGANFFFFFSPFL
jgi:hypothetical protein